MGVDRATAHRLYERSVGLAPPSAATHSPAEQIPIASHREDLAQRMAAVEEALVALANQTRDVPAPQFVPVPIYPAQQIEPDVIERRSVLATPLKIAGVVGLVILGAAVSGRALNGAEEEGLAGPTTTVYLDRTTGPRFSYSANGMTSGLTMEAQTFDTNVFKAEADITDAQMVGGSNPDGSINPESLGFTEGDTVFNFKLLAADQAEIPGCGTVNGASYRVSARNVNGPLSRDALRTVFAELESPEKVRMFTGLFNLDNPEDLEQALGSSLLVFLNEADQEISVLNSCTELLDE